MALKTPQFMDPCDDSLFQALASICPPQQQDVFKKSRLVDDKELQMIFWESNNPDRPAPLSEYDRSRSELSREQLQRSGFIKHFNWWCCDHRVKNKTKVRAWFFVGACLLLPLWFVICQIVYGKLSTVVHSCT